MDSQNLSAIMELSDELSELAESNFLLPITECTGRIKQKTSVDQEEIQWSEILEDTQTLLNLCRSTQNAHMNTSIEQETE